MLIGNYNVLHKTSGRFLGGGQIASNRGNWSKNGVVRAFLNQIPYSAIPNGCTPPFSWGIARKSGGLSSKTGVRGVGDITDLNLAGGLNGNAALIGSGDITLANILYAIVANATLSGNGTFVGDIGGTIPAAASLAGSGDIISNITAAIAMVASLSGSGDLSGDIAGALQAVANLLGSGDLSADITGKIEALAALSGEGDLTGAQIKAVWNMVGAILVEADVIAAMTGKGNIISNPNGNSNVVGNPSAQASMGADITVTGEFLTTSNVGGIVLQTIKPDLTIINDGVKKSSLIIPHSTDLT